MKSYASTIRAARHAFQIAEMLKLKRLGTLWFLLVSISCQQAQVLKVATYNIYFLDSGISQERRANLQAVIEKLDADIIGFQEINNPEALRNILPGDYEIAMIDDPDQVQELALAVRQPLTIESFEYVFPEDQFDNAFPRTRDLLAVRVLAHGAKLHVLVHHAKSRRGGRMFTDSQRESAASLIVDFVEFELGGKNVILLGDFNDNPDDRSLNILESGSIEAEGGPNNGEDLFLFNSSEELATKDYCSYGYSYLFNDATTDTFNLAVKGARAENNKWRGKEYDFIRDIEIKAILFDQILVSGDLKRAILQSGVFNGSVAVRGRPSRIRFVDGQLQYTERGSLTSDHVPVWALLDLSRVGR